MNSFIAQFLDTSMVLRLGSGVVSILLLKETKGNNSLCQFGFIVIFFLLSKKI